MKTQGRRRSSNVVDRRDSSYDGRKGPALAVTSERIKNERAISAGRRQIEAAVAEQRERAKSGRTSTSRDRAILREYDRATARKAKPRGVR